jgi:LmbE family N-acetylglucosaminyl deacetylase
MHRSVLAIAAHPDDIELVMSGTLMQLQRRGWQIHYFNIANGCCGSTTLDRSACAAVRLAEAQRAAELLNAVFHPPICDDLEIFYTAELHRKVAAVVRQAKPSIILTHSPSDYMEDHQNASRLAVGAAFVRAMPNFDSQPPIPIYQHDVAVYHAQPHGNRDPLGQLVVPTHFVDVTDLLDEKRRILAAHASQDQWLDATQKISAYLETMVELNREVGSLSRSSNNPTCAAAFNYAEGWRQHIHLGLGQQGFDPLASALQECSVVRT